MGKAVQRKIEIQRIHQEPAEFRSISGQAGCTKASCTEADLSIDFSTISLFFFIRSLPVDIVASSDHCFLTAGKLPAVRIQ